MKLGSVLLLSLALTTPTWAQEAVPSEKPTLSGTDLSRFIPDTVSAEDGRRTLGSLPANLGRSFIGVFSSENLTPLMIGAAATATAAPFDSHVQDGLLGQAPGASQAASTAGGFSVIAPATLGLFMAGRFAHDGRFRAFSYDAGQAVIVNGVYTGILKKAVKRQRPDASDTLSFPSGHSSTAFALATVADRHYGWKVGLPSYLGASAIALSRISNNKHYLTDVLAGATIGVICGRTVVRTNGEPVGRQRQLSLFPVTDPQGTGVGVGASLTW